MADLKISQLSSASALAGTEVVPVVQSSTTKKATIDQILTPAAGKGVSFSQNTPASGNTSQLLKDYQEGTWTPAADVGLIVIGTFSSSGTYTKIGRLVFVNFRLASTTSISWGASARIVSNLPFAAAVDAPVQIINTGTFNSASHGLAGEQFVYAFEAVGATTSVRISAVYTV